MRRGRGRVKRHMARRSSFGRLGKRVNEAGSVSSLLELSRSGDCVYVNFFIFFDLRFRCSTSGLLLLSSPSHFVVVRQKLKDVSGEISARLNEAVKFSFIGELRNSVGIN